MTDLEKLLKIGPVVDADAVDALHALNAEVRRAAARRDLIDVAFAEVDSPVGELFVAATPQGVVALSWDRDLLLEQLAAKVSPRVLEHPKRLDAARRQLDDYFAHKRTAFDLPIDWALTSGFRREVLRALVQVPYGEVVSYLGLATRVGNPKASRAVGSAMATNPIPLIVPCHRVLQTGGGLGGYSGRNGLVTKRFLLDLEGADLSSVKRTPRAETLF
jgi:methylated-DNA-[protein]-cysteine S-methyltransferase